MDPTIPPANPVPILPFSPSPTTIIDVRPSPLPTTARMPAPTPHPTSTPENRRTLARNFLPDFNISAEMRLLMFIHGRVHTFETICRKLESEIAAAREEHAALVVTHRQKQEELILVRSGRMKAMLPEDFTGPTVAELAKEIAHVGARLRVLEDLQMRKGRELEDTRGKLETKVEQCGIAERRWVETKGRVRMRGDGEGAVMGGGGV